jgi:hypothetical protein
MALENSEENSLKAYVKKFLTRENIIAFLQDQMKETLSPREKEYLNDIQSNLIMIKTVVQQRKTINDFIITDKKGNAVIESAGYWVNKEIIQSKIKIDTKHFDDICDIFKKVLDCYGLDSEAIKKDEQTYELILNLTKTKKLVAKVADFSLKKEKELQEQQKRDQEYKEKIMTQCRKMWANDSGGRKEKLSIQTPATKTTTQTLPRNLVWQEINKNSDQKQNPKPENDNCSEQQAPK